MNRYTIYCTPEQTKKALELGAPIETFGNKMICREMVEVAKSLGETEDVEQFLNKHHTTIIGDSSYRFPTTEQMINWLEEQDVSIEITRFDGELRGFEYHLFGIKSCKALFSSRREATLAAINEALEHLTKKNNK